MGCKNGAGILAVSVEPKVNYRGSQGGRLASRFPFWLRIQGPVRGIAEQKSAASLAATCENPIRSQSVGDWPIIDVQVDLGVDAASCSNPTEPGILELTAKIDMQNGQAAAKNEPGTNPRVRQPQKSELSC